MLTALAAMDAVAIVQSDTTVYDPPLKFLQVFEVGGVIKIQNTRGDDITYTIPDVASGGRAPFIIPGRIRKVYAADTDILDASMIGYV